MIRVRPDSEAAPPRPLQSPIDVAALAAALDLRDHRVDQSNWRFQLG